MNYKAYTKSTEWKMTRRYAMMCANYAPEIPRVECDVSPLTVHHLHYRTLGSENVKRDLVVLTQEQHKFIHKHEIRLSKNEKGEVVIHRDGKVFEKDNPLGL